MTRHTTVESRVDNLSFHNWNGWFRDSRQVMRAVALEATAVKTKSHRKAKRSHAKTILRLPDLEIAKTAVINSLSCPDAERGYCHAIDEFVDWYCSEPRLSFSKTVVVRYRMHLESRHLAPGTINLQLGAVPCIRSG